MKITKELVIIIALLIGILLLLSCIISTELVINNAAKTIETNKNLVEPFSIDIWIVKHERGTDWYVIGYILEIPNYVCSEQERRETPWNCSKISHKTTLEFVWFNIKTKEMHNAWNEIF